MESKEEDSDDSDVSHFNIYSKGIMDGDNKS